MANETRSPEPIVIKKYANRRLYNTETSSYVTLDDLCEMVKRGQDFLVYDAKTGDDLTRQILTQIIFEQESKGFNLLPVNFLRRIIGFYDDKMQDVLPHYLEATMDSFNKNQEKMREYMGKSLGGFSAPFSQLEEIGKQNMDLFQKAFQMWSPFDVFGGEDGADTDEKKPGGKKKK